MLNLACPQVFQGRFSEQRVVGLKGQETRADPFQGRKYTGGLGREDGDSSELWGEREPQTIPPSSSLPGGPTGQQSLRGKGR